MILEFFRRPALTPQVEAQLVQSVRAQTGIALEGVDSEWRYYVGVDGQLTPLQSKHLQWLLSETFMPESFGQQSFIRGSLSTRLEIGPRLAFESPWSSTAVAICHRCGIPQVYRLERVRRYAFKTVSGGLVLEEQEQVFPLLYDPMTEEIYRRVPTFEQSINTTSVRIIQLLKAGRGALTILQQENRQLGLGMDEQDLAFCLHLFTEILMRNPTDVELYQLAQANSEHCRHWFFRGRLIVDGQPFDATLMDVVKKPWLKCPGNSLVAFGDDSSAIAVPWQVHALVARQPGQVSALELKKLHLHPTLTAETHNFPTGIAPYPGAATGTGGRIRDNLSVGRGGLVGIAGAAYCTGNLHIPGFIQPWEVEDWSHPQQLASPLDIMIQASNGASDYGNCFGEPVICGFTRTCGLSLPDGYRACFKPMMYTVGGGQLDNRHVRKDKPEKDMYLVQIGGPAYRIGMGGGAASSMVQGDNQAELDFNAVQRGAPEMEQRVWRVIRACIELGRNNPIVSIHDLGAGGDCCALPELVVPAGARINIRALPVGDSSLSIVGVWINESQEREAMLLEPEDLQRFEALCQRENVPCTVVGQVTGDRLLVVYDETDGTYPVNLPLDRILEELPQKTFILDRQEQRLLPLSLPADLTVQEALQRVLRLPAVASKRFLTNKVDRSVTGLVAQQQCVGPHQVTLCDYAAMAQSHFSQTGVAFSLGEQPMKGLISPAAMARLAITEALLNLVGAKITRREDIRCSANWMWAAKLPGEGSRLLEAACAMTELMIELGIAVDGGKDSLSMAAKAIAPDGSTQIVKAPGQLVIATYAPMEDISKKITPDLEAGSSLLYINLSPGQNRLGGSALAQVYGQVGDDCPDLEDATLLCRTFDSVQELINQGLVTAVHDRCDGGLIVTLLEMAFAGCTGLMVTLNGEGTALEGLFNEEPGLVLACPSSNATRKALAILEDNNLSVSSIGQATDSHVIAIVYNGEYVLESDVLTLRSVWEETSSWLEKHQVNPACAKSEEQALRTLSTPPPYSLTFVPAPRRHRHKNAKPRVAIVREQGSNGDREMAAAFALAGLESWDVTMSDIVSGKVTLDRFRGLAFVGGFSFGDVLDAGKGWAGVIQYNETARQEFDRFYHRSDTFSLSVCNGCQLATLLGWVPWPEITYTERPRFIRNQSERFESRFATVQVVESPAIMLEEMAGSTLGIWVAHGEGQLLLPQHIGQMNVLRARKQAPLLFVGPDGQPTEEYPFNPNGSPGGITAICSADGRHLAMMPHPERTFQLWHWPWLPSDWRSLKASPWLHLFQNAYSWCQQNID